MRTEATPSSSQTPWVEQHVENVTPGQVYRLDGCLTVTGSGLTFVSLRVAWYAEQGGYGAALYQEDSPASTTLIGSEQCLSLAGAEAPCAARSARYGVVAIEDPDAVVVSSLLFSPEPGASPIPCPTPKPTGTPSPTATPSAQQTTAPAPSSAPLPAPTASAAEPAVFPFLVNGGFEDVREDGTPYGWRKVGGEMSASGAVSAEGDRSAALVSRTESTKWLYQTISVQGGSYYRLQAKALKNDGGVRETLLRVSWYESADGSGSQISTADSEALAKDSPRFVPLDTAAIQAPTEARSAKVRLLVRPASAARAVVYFDEVRFGRSAPSANQATAGEDGQPSTSTISASQRGAQPGTADGAVLSSRSGPAMPVNVKAARESQALPAAGRGRPIWPILLAVTVPAAGLAVMASSAWRKNRLEGNSRADE